MNACVRQRLRRVEIQETQNRGSKSAKVSQEHRGSIANLGNLFTSAVLVLTVCLLGPNKDRKICSEFHQSTNRLLGTSVADFCHRRCFFLWSVAQSIFTKHIPKAPTLSCVLTNASEGTGGR